MGWESIEGRQGCLTALRSALRRCAQRGRLVVVRGPAGIGKTKLMEAAARRWRSEGVRAVHVRIDAGTDRWGVDGTIDALRRDFNQFSDSGLIDGISVLTRLRASEAGDRRQWLSAVAAEVGRVFGRIGRLGPTAALFDDVLEVVDPVMLLIAARRPGCLVVASVRDDLVPAAAVTELVSLADEVIDLGPLSDDEIAAVAGSELDVKVLLALRAALGPLYGNPGTVLATLAALRDQGRLVSVDGRLRLKDSASISLPDGHDLLRRTRALGDVAPRLLAVAATFGELDVDDLPLIADTLGEDLAECGRTLDRLVETGVLVSDAHGRVVCPCPALAASVASEEYAAMRLLHATMTAASVGEAQVRGGENALAGSARKPAVITDHRCAWSTVGRGQAWSTTESRIVDLISLGCTNRRIASEIGVREKTVERHLTRLFTKTGCHTRVELVAASLEGRSGFAPGRAAAYGPVA